MYYNSGQILLLGNEQAWAGEKAASIEKTLCISYPPVSNSGARSVAMGFAVGKTAL
jgi:hypothetical protein